MKKLLTLICLSLIVSVSAIAQCGYDSNGKYYCCTPFGFCYPAPPPPPRDPIIMLPSYIPDSLIQF